MATSSFFIALPAILLAATTATAATATSRNVGVGYQEEEIVISSAGYHLDGIRHDDDGNNDNGEEEEESWLNDHDLDEILASLNTKNSDDGDLEEYVDMVLERKFKQQQQQQQQRAEEDESPWQQQQQWPPTLKGRDVMMDVGDRNLRAKKKKKQKTKKQQTGAIRNKKNTAKKANNNELGKYKNTNKKKGGRKKNGDREGNGIAHNESKRIKNKSKKNKKNNNNNNNKNNKGREQGDDDYHRESEKITILDLDDKPKNVRLRPPDRYRTCFACNRNKHFDLPPLEKDECGRTKYTIRRDAYNLGAQLYKDEMKIPKGVPRPYTCPCAKEGESRVEGEFQVSFFDTSGDQLTLDDKIAIEETTLRFLSDNVGSDDTFRAVCAYVGDTTTVTVPGIDGVNGERGRDINTTTVRFSIVYIVKDDYQDFMERMLQQVEGLMEKNGRSGLVKENGGEGGGEGSRGLQSTDFGGCTVDRQVSCCTQSAVNEGLDAGLDLSNRCRIFGCALPGSRACPRGNRRKQQQKRNLLLRSQPFTLPMLTSSNKGDAHLNRRLQEEPPPQCGSSNGLEDVPFAEAIAQGADYESDAVRALLFEDETENRDTVAQCSVNWFFVNELEEFPTIICDEFFDECDGITDLAFEVGESRCLAPSASPSSDAPTTDVPTTAIPTTPFCSDFNLCIAIDMSGSVCNGLSSQTCEGCEPAQFCNSGGVTQSICCSNFGDTLEITMGLVTALGEGASAEQDYSIVYYGNTATEASRLNSWTQAVETLNDLEYTGGGANMAEAISLCQSTLDQSPPDRKNYMLIFLDGVPTRPVSTAQSAARAAASNAKEKGSIIIPFLRQGGSESNLALLSYLTNYVSTEGKVFLTDSEGLNNLQNSLEEEGICLQSEGSILG